MTPLILEEFIDEVFGNILEIRETNRRLLEVLYVRQREQHPVIQSVGDIFLDAATEFRTVYPEYVGQHPLAEKRMKEELEHNTEFRLFIEVRGYFIYGFVDDGRWVNLAWTYFILFFPLEMLSSTCSASRRQPPSRFKALPQPASRASAKIPCASHRCVSRDRRIKSRRRLPQGGDRRDPESAERVPAPDVPVCDGEGKYREMGMA